MLNILDFLGTVGGNILSLPGILGLGLGMMTRNWLLAALMGATIGALQTLVFHHFDLAAIFAYELVIAIAVGIIFALLGCAIRHRGATV
ncbi:hypothetical protein ACEYYB_10700 [Paracoccus sp. p4-l81]|uniref:hypothetical protein n=1 Tax=unclassified Paracoccus (in: a-proteobacteria) TaxID=2688777 RepID=UPI0035B99560